MRSNQSVKIIRKEGSMGSLLWSLTLRRLIQHFPAFNWISKITKWENHAALKGTLYKIDASNNSSKADKSGLGDLAIVHFQQRNHPGCFHNLSVDCGLTVAVVEYIQAVSSSCRESNAWSGRLSLSYAAFQNPAGCRVMKYGELRNLIRALERNLVSK